MIWYLMLIMKILSGLDFIHLDLTARNKLGMVLIIFMLLVNFTPMLFLTNLYQKKKSTYTSNKDKI